MGSKTQPVDKYSQNEYDTAQLRKMLAEAFSGQELIAFTFDHFLKIYDEWFSYWLPKGIMIHCLIEGCYRNNQLFSACVLNNHLQLI